MFSPPEYPRVAPETASDKYHTKLHQYFVKDDRCQLDTLEIIPPDQQKLNKADRKYLINFCGNAESCRQNPRRLIQLAHELNLSIIAFDYSNVNYSAKAKRLSSAQLVADGIAQVQHLLDQGVKPENIVLSGWSLGGGVASLVAKHYHDKNQKLYLFNDRSFSNLTHVIVGWIRTLGSGTGHTESYLGKLVGYLAWPFIKSILVLSGWEIEAAKAYHALPAAYKEYMVIRSPKAIRNSQVSTQDDAIIPHYASLHTAVKPITNNKPMKFERSNRKFYSCLFENAHCASRKDLQNHRDCTATDFFKSFVDRIPINEFSEKDDAVFMQLA